MTQFGNIVSQVVTDDLFTFVLDNVYNNIVKIEYSGDIVDTYEFSNTVGFNNTSLQHQKDDSLIVYDFSGKIINIVNPQDLTVNSTISLPSSAGSNIALDISGNYIIGTWESAAVDNNNSFYTIETPSSADYGVLGFNVSADAYDGGGTTIDQITAFDFNKVCFRYNLSSVSTSQSSVYLSNFTREPLTFTNNNYEEVQFTKLFPNNFSNGLISKPFYPQKVFTTKENRLLIINDTREIIELYLNPSKPARFNKQVALFGSDISTGSNLYNLAAQGLSGDVYDSYVSSTIWSTISTAVTGTVNVNATYELDRSTNTFETYYWFCDSENRSLFKTDNNYTINECFSLPEAIDTLGYPDETFSQYKFTQPPATTYDWHRKYDWIANDKNDSGFKATLYTLSGGSPVKHTLQYNDALDNEQFYHLALTYDQDTGNIKFYVDNEIVEEKTITPNQPVYSFYETGAIIGSHLLRSNSINKELDCNMYSFNGAVFDVRMYDFMLSQSQIAQIMLSNIKIQSIDWNIATGARQYIDQIERFFMHRPPGSASAFYKIRLVGLNITDLSIRADIEDIINNTIEKVAPAYTSLYSIEWV